MVISIAGPDEAGSNLDYLAEVIDCEPTAPFGVGDTIAVSWLIAPAPAWLQQRLPAHRVVLAPAGERWKIVDDLGEVHADAQAEAELLTSEDLTARVVDYALSRHLIAPAPVDGADALSGLSAEDLALLGDILDDHLAVEPVSSEEGQHILSLAAPPPAQVMVSSARASVLAIGETSLVLYHGKLEAGPVRSGSVHGEVVASDGRFAVLRGFDLAVGEELVLSADLGGDAGSADRDE